MHELALAEAIVAVAEAHASGRRVTRVEARVGWLRQVVPAALTFSFELASLETPVEGAELVIEIVPVRVRCRSCGGETEIEAFPFACGPCGAPDVEVTDGEQFEVVALELEDEPVAA